MKDLLTLLCLVTIVVMVSCKNNSTPLSNNPSNSKNISILSYSDTQQYALPQLLQASLQQDSFLYEKVNFRFIAGHLFTKSQKHAVVLYATNTATKIEVYVERNNAWEQQMIDSAIDVFWVQAGCEFIDMDFDNVKDLIVHRSVSNGFAMQAIHLFIYKNSTKFIRVTGADTLFNLTPVENNELKSEEVIWCRNNGQKEVKNLYYTFKNNQLVYLRTKMPCITQ